MATPGQPDPTQAGGAPDGGAAPAASPAPPPPGPEAGGGGGAPSAAPANPKQVMLAQMYQLCKRLAQEDPTLSAGMQKAAEGIQEAQTAMVTQPQPQPAASNPPM
jgi:hypothetical protein